MKIKILYLSLITFVIIGLAACKQKQNEKMPGFFNSLLLLQAYPVYPYMNDYLPLEMFSENGKMYVQYIKNGKPLGKISIIYNHSEEIEYDSVYFFDELIGKEKTGTYILSRNFECDGYISNGSSMLEYVSTNKDTIGYWFNCQIFESDIVIDTKNLQKAENKLFELKKDDDDTKYAKNFRYLIHSNVRSLNYPFKKLRDNDYYPNIITSEDNNIRIYYLQGFQDKIVQYRDGKDIRDGGTIGGSSAYRFCDDLFDREIFIKKITLNDRTYYLIEFNTQPDRYNSVCCCGGHSVALYTIENGQLLQKEIFFTGKASLRDGMEIDDEIVVEFCQSAGNTDTTLFRYDEKEKILYVPLVYGDSLTNYYSKYRWDGEYFSYRRD